MHIFVNHAPCTWNASRQHKYYDWAAINIAHPPCVYHVYGGFRESPTGFLNHA